MTFETSRYNGIFSKSYISFLDFFDNCFCGRRSGCLCDRKGACINVRAIKKL
jgi:hypothetical protein